MADKKNGKWIQKANLKKGAFTKKAKKADESVKEYAEQVTKKGSKATKKTKKQGNLALTLQKMAKKSKAKK